MIELDKRLAMTAGLVTPGCVLADIGTDHAYLPCFLAARGVISRAIAADIAAGPLQNAEKTVCKYGLSDRIECRLSNGLLNFSADECSEIVIAGMGGNLIADILSAAAWVCTPGVHLILQPMTHSEDVRRFLLKNGFTVERECAVRDGRRTYIAISAVYTGNLATCEPDPFYLYFGCHPENNTADSDEFIKNQKKRLQQKLNGYRAAGKTDSDEFRTLSRVLEDIRIKDVKA